MIITAIILSNRRRYHTVYKHEQAYGNLDVCSNTKGNRRQFYDGDLERISNRFVLFSDLTEM